MFWVYCKTHDEPRKVGNYVCKSNFFRGINQDSHILKEGSEDNCWIIENCSKNETSAMIYRLGPEVVVMEIDDECVVNVVEPLMMKSGLEPSQDLQLANHM